MQNSASMNSQFTEERLDKMLNRFLRGENWKKFAKPKSKRTNKQDSDQFALSKFVELFKKWWKKG